MLTSVSSCRLPASNICHEKAESAHSFCMTKCQIQPHDQNAWPGLLRICTCGAPCWPLGYKRSRIISSALFSLKGGVWTLHPARAAKNSATSLREIRRAASHVCAGRARSHYRKCTWPPCPEGLTDSGEIRRASSHVCA